jgi:hypothetical protein
MGYKTYASFWNMRLAKKIKSKTEKVELIYSANTLSHINDLNSVLLLRQFLNLYLTKKLCISQKILEILERFIMFNHT